jgi:hypothetical protein
METIGNPFPVPDTRVSFATKNNIPKDFWGIGYVEVAGYGKVTLDINGNISGKYA